MPTIFQLPSTESVSASDLIPISQGGSAHSVSVGVLLAQTQPAIIVASPSLLGRISIGPGGPDTIAIGDGLSLNSGTLTSSNFDLSSLPLQTSLSPDDQVIVTNTGTSYLIGVDQIRDLFTAGPNITIDAGGVISASTGVGGGSYSLTSLSPVTTIGTDDLVGMSQNGEDHTITYGNLIDGLTIDLLPTAAAASDGDTFWTGQTSNIMVRQTLSALWPWVSGKLASWKHPVIELDTDTVLDETIHNNAIVVCSSPISISGPAASGGSGFSCQLINASSATVVLSSDIIASNGLGELSPWQCASIFCATYSAGTMTFASISAGSSATTAPGQPSDLTASSISSSSIALTWTAATSGGAASVYSVQYQITGTTPWLAAGQTGGSQTFVASGLLASTSYDFAINASNNIGTGPGSSVLTVSTSAASILPGAPTAVTFTNVTTSSITCSWTAPAVGGSGLVYGVQYRLTGQSTWSNAASDLAATTVTVSSLVSASSYDFQVTATTSAGSGPPSAVSTALTAQAVGLVTSITWALVPAGSFVDGTGAIGVNAHVNPATAALQFGFSTSQTVPPTSWMAGVHVNSDLWGQYSSDSDNGRFVVWLGGRYRWKLPHRLSHPVYCDIR